MYRQQTSGKNLPVVQIGDLHLKANCSTVTINYKLRESGRRHEFLSSQAFILTEFARLHVVGHATLVMLGVGKTRDG